MRMRASEIACAICGAGETFARPIRKNRQTGEGICGFCRYGKKPRLPLPLDPARICHRCRTRRAVMWDKQDWPICKSCQPRPKKMGVCRKCAEKSDMTEKVILAQGFCYAHYKAFRRGQAAATPLTTLNQASPSADAAPAPPTTLGHPPPTSA